MTLADLLDGAFRVIRTRPRTVFGMAAAILFPLALVSAVLRDELHGWTATLSAAAVGSIAPWLLGGALAALMTAWYAGREMGAREALVAAGRRFWPLLGADLLLLPIKAVAIVLCVIPIVFVSPLFVLSAPAIVVEQLGPVAGPKRSVSLVSRRYGWVLLDLLVAAVAIGAPAAGLNLLAESMAKTLADPLRWMVEGTLVAAIGLIFETAILSFAVLIYLDLRVRTEGLDLELGTADAFGRVG